MYNKNTLNLEHPLENGSAQKTNIACLKITDLLNLYQWQIRMLITEFLDKKT